MLEGERAAPGQCYHGWVRNAEQIRRELTKERKGGGKKKSRKERRRKKKAVWGFGVFVLLFRFSDAVRYPHPARCRSPRRVPERFLSS